MQQIATFKQIKKIRDERFIADNIHEYTLLVNVGSRDLQIAVLDDSDNRILFLEDYVFPSVSSTPELLSALDELWDQHAFLQAGFWKTIKIAVKSQKLVQVPIEFFVPESADSYLSLNAKFSKKEDDVHFIEMESSSAVTIFAVQKEIKTFFAKVYPQKQFTITHQSAALIEGVMQYATSRNDSPLYLYVDRFKLHILSVKEGKLVYYNQFTITSFQDYVKYIMLVLKTLGMDQETSEVILWGYLGSNSPHYHEFCKYIQHVTFGKRPSHVTFGYPFDEAQDHHYFDLYNINLSL